MHDSVERKKLKCFGLNDMNGKALRREETSSGYSSRESLHEIIKQQPQDSDSNCSCKISTSSRSTQRYYSESPISDLDSIKKKPSSRHSHSSSQGSCCSQNESLSRVNEQLLLQNRLLEEQNQSLLEELNVSRRFYQGTLADLCTKLSAAENRIKYLKEVVSTQEEALDYGKADVVDNLGSFNFSPDPPAEVPVLGVRKPQKSSSVVSFPSVSVQKSALNDTPRSVVSSSGSIVSECSGRVKRNALQGKNFARMKEHLLEKNQNLKTDIQLLKVKTDVPRSASVPVLWPAKPQGLPMKQLVNEEKKVYTKTTANGDTAKIAPEQKKKTKSRHK